MEQELLTFRDWRENFIRIDFNARMSEIKLVSFDRLVDDVYDMERVKEILNDEKKYLLNHYRNNFDKIQKQFQNLIKESI
jgi:hypothetical protein